MKFVTIPLHVSFEDIGCITCSLPENKTLMWMLDQHLMSLDMECQL